MEEKQQTFEEKVKPILTYVGAIGAIITSIAYIAIVLIMVFGIVINKDAKQTIVFSLINAVIGIIIIQFMKIQGISFAKKLPQNEDILKKYRERKIKTKKIHSLKYFWITSIAKDIFIKALTICISTFGVIYLVIQGSNNYTLLLLAFVNLLLFICFGLISLVKAYDFFNEEQIPFLINLLEEKEIKMEEKNDNS